MKKRIPFMLVSVLLLGGCQTLDNMGQKETFGTLFGAVGGAVLGSQFGGGKGKLVGVTVGTLAGGWLGNEIGRSLDEADRLAMTQVTQRVLENPVAQTSTWSNPQSGSSGEVQVTEINHIETQVAYPKLIEKPESYNFSAMQIETGQYKALKAINVRSAATTDASIITGLSIGDRVEAVGRTDNNWLLVAKNNRTLGYVYGPLLEIVGNEPPSFVNSSHETPLVLDVKTECRDVTRTVRLKDGHQEQDTAKFCKSPTGWEKVA